MTCAHHKHMKALSSLLGIMHFQYNTISMYAYSNHFSSVHSSMNLQILIQLTGFSVNLIKDFMLAALKMCRSQYVSTSGQAVNQSCACYKSYHITLEKPLLCPSRALTGSDVNNMQVRNFLEMMPEPSKYSGNSMTVIVQLVHRQLLPMHMHAYVLCVH